MFCTEYEMKRRISPKVKGLRVKSTGRTYRVGDTLNPDCGHVPTDYIITGFMFHGSRLWSFYGYHKAMEAKERRFSTRGGFFVDDVTILYEGE